MNTERLLKPAEFLETNPHGFDFGVVTGFQMSGWVLDPLTKTSFHDPRETHHNCQTVACAIGFLPAMFPEDWSWDNDGSVVFKEMGSVVGFGSPFQQEFFGISSQTFTALFEPLCYPHGSGTTAKEVAARIRRLVVLNNCEDFCAELELTTE